MTAANLERKLLRFPAPKLLARIAAETPEQNRWALRRPDAGLADRLILHGQTRVQR